MTDLKKAINKMLVVDISDFAYQGNQEISFEEMRQQFEFLTIVYLQNGCQPCYPRFIEWHQRMDSIGCPDNYSVLFIIEGNSYEEFMTNVLNIDYVDNHYYVIMDSNLEFLSQNESVPKWIIDAGILIDSESKIKMVGAPWINEDMTQLFYKIVGSP